MRVSLNIVALFLLLMLTSCAGISKMTGRGRKQPTATGTTSETVKVVEKEEKLVAVDKTSPDPHRYFVIIGSFRNPDNAKKFQSRVKEDGFTSELLRNEAGLYRVSVLATDDVQKARSEVKRIWSAYPDYSDAWLLIQVK